MKKIILICSAGMSSSIIARKLNNKFKNYGDDIIVSSAYLGKGINSLKENCYDLYLLSPQIMNYKDVIISDYQLNENQLLSIPEHLYIPIENSINRLGELIKNKINYQLNKEEKKGEKMKILLVCAGGFSTSIIMGKVKKWAEENEEDITIEATGKEAYTNIWEDYDCILLGPQIAYALDEIKENVSIPVACIEPMVYALADSQKVVDLAKNITQ